MRCASRRALLGLALLAAAGCNGGAERPNVLLVTIDTLRPDRLSCYGYRGHETPHIDRLAAEGALFLNAVSDTPWTTASMSSVMTGNYATRHGFKSSNVSRLAPENVTLAEVLKGEGYATAAVIGSFPLDSIYQLDQGFDVYDDTFTRPVWVMPDHEFEPLESRYFDSPEAQRLFILSKLLNDSRREDGEVTDAALAWLAEPRSGPFFLWVHYFGPHERPDWTVPESQRRRRHVEMYDPGVRNTDREVGRLLAYLDAEGLADRTLVALHADHGESLGEQGLLGHGELLNDASIRVPLILRLPGTIEAGARVRRLARNIDLFATVLDAAGATPPEPVDGESALPRIARGPRRWLARLAGRFDGEADAYLETYYPAHTSKAAVVKLPDGTEALVGRIHRGVRRGRFKLVRTDLYPLLDVSRGSVPEAPEAVQRRFAGERLYDLDAPGGENTDVRERYPRIAQELSALLDEHLAAERNTEPIRTMSVDEEMRLRLEALGYGE